MLSFGEELDKAEAEQCKQIKKDFSKQIDVFERGLEALAVVINQESLGERSKFISAAKLKVDPDAFPDSISSDLICFLSSLLLLGEALLRLIAARRLLLSGYFNRALGCNRDALEAAMYANICLYDEHNAKIWQKNRKVQKPKGFIYHQLLSEKLWNSNSGYFNTFGTHAHFTSAYLSAVPQLNLLLPNDQSSKEVYTISVIEILLQLTSTCYRILKFIQDSFSNAFSNVPNITEILHDLVQGISVLSELLTQHLSNEIS